MILIDTEVLPVWVLWSRQGVENIAGNENFCLQEFIF
jgi:hypothetical protein